jgi:site-specific recombinase XerD
MSTLDIADLLPSWQLALQAERKSPLTVKSYTAGVNAFLKWCAATGNPAEITKTHVQAFVVDLLDKGAQPKTAAARLLGVRRFAVWLTDEGELPADPLLGIKQPKIDRKVIEALTEDQLKALIKACNGRKFTDRRDEAIIRLMAETGLRAGEVIGLEIDDINVQTGFAVIRRGKGGKGRIVPFGPQTAQALDRYQRLRRTHRLASTPQLWVGADNWRKFNYFGLRHALERRAEAAGITNFHPHLLRHTFATRWKAARGTDDGLMSVAGWSSRDMIDRYAGAAASDRAAAEARNLGLGNL